MLNILSFLLDLINQHVIWLYLACLVVVVLYVRSYATARRDRANTIFTIEKEVAAHKEGQAMSGIGVVLGLAVVVTIIRFYLIPTLDPTLLETPTPTFTLLPPTRVTAVLPTATPTFSVTVLTPTARPSPVLQNTPTSAPEPTLPPPPPAACPDANVRITLPGSNATVAGKVAIHGTANHGRFQFYKVEYALGEQPSSWHVIHDIHRNPVIGGPLEELDTSDLPNGPAWLQLTVVDLSGNFPPPCRVRIVIRN